jgi:hypothetical protein
VKPERIGEQLAALRDAGAELRRRPTDATLDALGRVLDGWRKPESSWRRALANELPAATGFSPEVVAEGLERGLADWSGDALCEQIVRELAPSMKRSGASQEFVTGFDTTAVVLAGSIPMPTLLALIAPLALHSPVLAKTSSHDPVTAHLVARSLAETDPLLGRCVACVDFPGNDPDCADALLAADCVVAYGSDATIGAVRARIDPGRRLVAYGHRASVAVVAPATLSDAEIRDAAARLALDVALWDQLGCLSPIAAYVIDPRGDQSHRFADALARAFADLAPRLPRGRVDAAAGALAAHARADAELRAAAGAPVALHSGTDGAWCVVVEADAAPRPTPLHRFLRVHPVAGRDALRVALAPLSRYLAAVGIAGFEKGSAELARELAELGASRVCSLGRMQSPPLAWQHDNRGVFTPLARLASFETER